MTTLKKLGGAVCTAPDTLDALAHAWKQTPPGDTWFLVHGGGPQLDAALREHDGDPVRVEGLRVTSKTAAHAVQATLDDVGEQMVAGLVERGVPAVHVPTSDKRLHAVPRSDELERVGIATDFHADGLDQPGVHVVTPVGFDAEGPLNVNADEAALAVAKALGVRRLVLATDVPHVRGADGNAIDLLTPGDVLGLIEDGTAQGGMVPKLRNAILALESGVHEVAVGTLESVAAGTATRVRLVRKEPVVA